MAATSSDARAVDIRDLDVTFATDGGDVHAVRGVSLDAFAKNPRAAGRKIVRAEPSAGRRGHAVR